MTRLAPVLLLALTGCAVGSLDCTDLSRGACKVSFQRFLTDTSATFTGPQNLGFTYSSNPNAAATQEAFAAISRLTSLLGARIPGPAPAPVPVVPKPEAFDPMADPTAWHGAEHPSATEISGSSLWLLPVTPNSRSRSFPLLQVCPAIHGPLRVSGQAPKMIEGVAHAVEM